MLGICPVDPGEHIEHRTMVVHNHPTASPAWSTRARLTARARTPLLVGNALIQPTAPAPTPTSSNRNLVLTPALSADSRAEPRNRKRQHHRCRSRLFGGPLRTTRELFYPRNPAASPETDARKLVVRGFFGELVEEIGIPAISEHLMTVIDRRLAPWRNDAMAQVPEDK